MAVRDHASLVTHRNHNLVQHHSNQFITEKNMCDDVNANKSLNGNERETPSIRSGLVARLATQL